MTPFFVGPIATQVFLDRFLPPSDPPSDPPSVSLFSKGMFTHFIDLLSKRETASYDEFVSILTHPHRPRRPCLSV